jgi:transposase
VTIRSHSRDKFLPCCTQLAPGYLIAMEASSSAHHWARRLRAMGLAARIIAAHLKTDEQAARAQQLMGVGPVGASAVVATVGDFKPFRNGPQFGAWPGLTPWQNSSGGKNNPGDITRRGDVCLRTLLIRGAKSVVWTAHKRDDPVSRWVHGLREKHGWQKAAVALANRNAPIL